MFPIHDENPTDRFPFATLALIGLNVVSWIFLQGLGTQIPLLESLCDYGLIPGVLLGSVGDGTVIPLGPEARCTVGDTAAWLTPITSMFMHGGWMHIIGNMWFLWVFGDNIEDAMGPVRFVVFYLIAGLAAAFAQVASDPASAIPMVGASGAIGGVMGGYALLHPHARIRTLLWFGFYVTTIMVPAIFMLGYWFIIQIVSGAMTMSASGGGVAFWAHAGGFLAGAVLVGPFSGRRVRIPSLRPRAGRR